MTTRPPGHPERDPLTPEEREMAARLARLGPHDGPSAVLDARIIAAAHAAASDDAGAAPAPRRRGVRRALLLPAGWLTGVGLAASMALVLGVAWQLRPPPTVVPARGEAPLADGGFVPAQPVASARPRLIAPPAPPSEPSEAGPARRVVPEASETPVGATQSRTTDEADMAGSSTDRAADAAPA
ncbi:hypothetical protein ACJQWL_13855, partial [Lysobacter sp. A3-1-A15]